HIPGTPNVIVENMPGAGSLTAANHLYNVAPKDGTVIAHFHGNMFMQQVLGGQGVQFDSTKFEFLGTPVSDSNICVATASSGIKSIADAQKPGGRQYIVGGTAPGSATDDVATVLAEALNLDIKLVRGYNGTSDMRLAMEGGELDGIC